jgi:hypothetical protein
LEGVLFFPNGKKPFRSRMRDKTTGCLIKLINKFIGISKIRIRKSQSSWVYL